MQLARVADRPPYISGMKHASLEDLLAASRQSAALGHHQVGAEQAERALRIRPDGAALSVLALHRLRLGNIRGCLSAGGAAVPLLRRDAQWSELSKLEGVQTVACLQANWVYQGLVHARLASEAAKLASDPEAGVWADCRMAQVFGLLGDQARSMALFEQAERAAITLESDEILFSILHNRAWFTVDALIAGHSVKADQARQALLRLDRAQVLADRLRNVHSQGICMLNRSRLLRVLGEEAASRSLAQAALALGQAHLLTQLHVGSQVVVAEWLLHDGMTAEVLATLHSLRQSLPQADLISHVELLRLMVKAHRQRHAFEEALQAFEELHSLTLAQAKARADLQTWISLHHEELEHERVKARMAQAQAELQRERALQWEQAAHLDPLTGLGNRRAAEVELPKLWSEAVQSGRALFAVLIDLDHFKQINDRHGHEIGDRVLSQVGSLLLAAIRPGDLAVRLGGEEFLVLLPGTSVDAAEQVCERLRLAVEGHAWECLVAGLRVTASLGAAQVTHLEEPWVNADRAVYAAKARGRNCVVLF